ncbi:MAG: hypothetical protein ACLFV8_12940 [Alphaproteobacteria bacterium]
MSALCALFVIAVGVPSFIASSDEPLLLELVDRNPDVEIWPKSEECPDDCIASVSSVFKYGKWRITDWDCMRDYGAAENLNPDMCTDYFNWKLGGLIHPRYHFSEDGPGLDSPEVFVGNVTALLGRRSASRVFLVQDGFFKPRYHLLVAEGGEGVVTKLTEYALACDGAGTEEWQRRGYRHHAGSYDIFRYDYCEIRDLNGFRSLARRALKRPPSGLWERIGDLPEKADTENQEADGN